MAEHSTSSTASAAAASTTDGAAKGAAKAASEQNPAFRRMGLPRLRLPSRNWSIFWTITGSFAAAVMYDKYQTKRTREKWVQLVAHVADEHLDIKTLPRRVTIYLQAPPGDGLRTAREHFHLYIKPVLVAAAMDWDVVEGRQEGDVRHKTAEKIRKWRRRKGEGEPETAEDDGTLTVEALREKNGDVEYPGVAGDIVVGRHAWKEYIRGLHEGYLGPADLPKDPKEHESTTPAHHESTSNAQKSSPTETVTARTATGATTSDMGDSPVSSLDTVVGDSPPVTEAQTSEETLSGEALTSDYGKETQNEGEAKTKAEDEKPKRRFPPPSILPGDYAAASLSPFTPDILGPSVAVRLPHLLGFLNTPTRIYRFLNRRRVQDDIGRQVAAVVLAAHRPYTTAASYDASSASEMQVEVPEQAGLLSHEEKDWYKLVHRPRQEHEESLWTEPVVLDERISSRMRAFELSAADEARARRIAAGEEEKAQHET